MASPNAIDGEQPNQQQCLSGTNDSKTEVPMRTVYIGGITPGMIGEIHSHFGQFGEIESVAMRFEDEQTRWCLVQFKRAKDAVEALLRTRSKWNDCDVRAADPWHQPDHPLQVAPEQDSDSNISVALNDDCLLAIFMLLKPSCLTNVAGVCKRFNQQAKKTFALKHKHLNLSEQFDRHHDSIEAMKHFGKDIQSLSVDALLFMNEAAAFHMIGQYCGPKLKQLELCNFQFCSDLGALRPTFAGIEQLNLRACSGSVGLRELMTGCGELESLLLAGCMRKDLHGTQYILSGTFPKLQVLSISCYNNFGETFNDFVARHPTLVKLSIDNVKHTPRLLRTIGQHVKNLQELKFIQVLDSSAQLQNDATYIGHLSSLKKLQLHVQNGSIVPVLNALVTSEVPIESMEIHFDRQSDFDQAIDGVSRLKRIKVLHLTTYENARRMTDEDVVKLAECLPELEKLQLEENRGCCVCSRSYHSNSSKLSTIGLRKMLVHANKLKLLKLLLVHSIKFDVDDYKVMLSTVQKRKEKLPLVIEIHGEGDQADVSAAVLAENQGTFNINIMKRKY